MPLHLNETSARKIFKEKLGSANHLIITSIVGLDAIERGVVSSIPEELHVAWSPMSKIASARRSRRLILDMALVHAVDALDLYLFEALNNSHLIQSEELKEKLQESDTKISKKFGLVTQAFPLLDEKIIALMWVMLAWRNKGVHGRARLVVEGTQWDVLKRNHEWLHRSYSGLDINRLHTGFSQGKAPTLKETLSLIRATQHFVKELESILLNELDQIDYLRCMLKSTFSNNEPGGEGVDLKIKDRIQSIWGVDIKRKRGCLKRLLIRNGFSEKKSMMNHLFLANT